MAYNTEYLAKLEALKALAERTKGEIDPIKQSVAAAVKSGKMEGNTVNLYTSTDASGAAAFSFDFPAEMFLDQTKTQFVAKFTWDEAVYPGSTNPKLDGKPVMVLAVKGEGDSATYSFLNMAALVDTYTAKAEEKDASTTITISGYEVEVKVNISAEAGNQLQRKADGLYVSKSADVDISGKADKVGEATTGNFAGLDENGNLTDSGKKPGDFSKVEASETNGNVKVDGAEVTVYTEPEDVVHGHVTTTEEVAEMLNEVFGIAAE